jgi:hypothetical protein
MASLVSGASPVVVCISLLKCTDLPPSDYGVGHLLPEFSVFGAVKDAAANLPGMGEPSSDPYCVFKLLNRDTSEQVSLAGFRKGWGGTKGRRIYILKLQPKQMFPKDSATEVSRDLRELEPNLGPASEVSLPVPFLLYLGPAEALH